MERLKGSGIKKLPSGRYQIDFRSGDGVRRRESFDRERDARDAITKIRAAVRDGQYVAPEKVPTFGEAAARWIEAKKTSMGRDGKPRKATTIAHWQNHLDGYLLPTWKEKKMDSITVTMVEESARAWQSQGKLSGKSVNKMLTTAAAIFKDGLRFRYLKSNPAEPAQRLAVGSNTVRDDGEAEKSGDVVTPEMVYTPEELLRLIDGAAPGFGKAIVTTVSLTGVRHGEALALKWGDLDLVNGKMTIRRNWADQYDVEGKPEFYTPKTRSGVREIDMADELVSCLKRWKLACPISEWDLVFPKADGWPQDRKTVLRGSLYPAIRRAGIKKLDMKALRHTFASILIAQGAPITEVASIMGHADPVITLKVYSHWLPRQKTGTTAKLAASVFNGPDTSRDRVGHLVDTSGVKAAV